MSISPVEVLSSTARFNLLLAVINDEKSRGVLNHEKKTNNERKGKEKDKRNMTASHLFLTSHLFRSTALSCMRMLLWWEV
jgi:hypothetical protein